MRCQMHKCLAADSVRHCTVDAVLMNKNVEEVDPRRLGEGAGKECVRKASLAALSSADTHDFPEWQYRTSCTAKMGFPLKVRLSLRT